MKYFLGPKTTTFASQISRRGPEPCPGAGTWPRHRAQPRAVTPMGVGPPQGWDPPNLRPFWGSSPRGPGRRAQLRPFPPGSDFLLLLLTFSQRWPEKRGRDRSEASGALPAPNHQFPQQLGVTGGRGRFWGCSSPPCLAPSGPGGAALGRGGDGDAVLPGRRRWAGGGDLAGCGLSPVQKFCSSCRAAAPAGLIELLHSPSSPCSKIQDLGGVLYPVQGRFGSGGGGI